MNDLRTALHDLAEGQEFRPDPDAWDRGRRARRRSRIVAGAAALGVVAVVAGVGALATGRPQGFAPAEQDVVPGGAIPSRIYPVPSYMHEVSDLAIGRGSLAWVTSLGQPVVVSATDGKYQVLDLPELNVISAVGSSYPGAFALSPDGHKLAYPWRRASGHPDQTVEGGIAVVDLIDGSVDRFSAEPKYGIGIEPRSLAWSPDSRWVAWHANESMPASAPPHDPYVHLGRIDTSSLTQELTSTDKVWWLTIADDGEVVVMGSSSRLGWGTTGDPAPMPVAAVDRLRGMDRLRGTNRALANGAGSMIAVSDGPETSMRFIDVRTGRLRERPLSGALGQEPALTTPVGWATDSLVVAGVYTSSVQHLALVTSPDQPRGEWTYRILAQDLREFVDSPPSVAVDLVPDLDGTSSQQLTHDFGEPGQRDISWLIGLGVAAAVAVLLGLRWLARWAWRRRL